MSVLWGVNCITSRYIWLFPEMIEDIGQQKEAAQGYSPQAQLMLFGHMCVLHKNTECDVKDTLLAL